MRTFFAASLLVLSLTGCSGASTPTPVDVRPESGCAKHTAARPVDARELLRGFRRFGIRLTRDHCITPDDVFVASTKTGDVICRLFSRSYAPRLSRIKPLGEAETTLDFLNVQCSVRSDDGGGAYQRRVARVVRVLLALKR